MTDQKVVLITGASSGIGRVSTAAEDWSGVAA
jgi:NADP-dependent 3-hydroxy acid dehydrogenase YdfG